MKVERGVASIDYQKGDISFSKPEERTNENEDGYVLLSANKLVPSISGEDNFVLVAAACDSDGCGCDANSGGCDIDCSCDGNCCGDL